MKAAETEIRAHFEARIRGRRGAPKKRAAFEAAVARVTALRAQREPAFSRWAWENSHAQRLSAWKSRQALRLAEMAGQNFDEHGSSRGDYLSTASLDFVPAHEAGTAPYCDMGGEGVGLVRVTRSRVYPKSSGWWPTETATNYLVGRNEAGTYFAHPVPTKCTSVRSALNWIWGGRAEAILRRQGDIALIAGAGPKVPELPRGHVVDQEAGVVRHATHPDLPLPRKGERIIVGRRAFARVSEPTRD